jgi:hypothetical protein
VEENMGGIHQDRDIVVDGDLFAERAEPVQRAERHQAWAA